MSIAEDLGSWASIVGLLLPALVALLQRTHWGNTTNAVVYGAAVVAASVVYGWIKYGGDFTWAHWQGTLLAVIVWGTATYHLYYRPSGIVDKLRAVPVGFGRAAPAKKGKR